MSDVTIKRIEEIEPYRGPNALEGIEYMAAGNALGVRAWGMSVLALAPGATTYPEHDHADDGQEEVYVLLEGDAVLRAGEEGEEWPVERGTLVRVGPGVKRKWLPGENGVTLLALGAIAGRAFEPRG